MQDLIELNRPAWGKLFQGQPVTDEETATLPKPLALVYMDAPPVVRIDHASGIHLEIVIEIDDSPEAILPDSVLVGVAKGIASLLRGGCNVRVQCGASVSRSSYMTVAVVMVLHQLGYAAALAVVASSRTFVVPQPNTGFEAHLRRLESQLRS